VIKIYSKVQQSRSLKNTQEQLKSSHKMQ